MKCPRMVYLELLVVTYIKKNDGVATVFLLGPVLAGIFMVELATRIIPTVTSNIYH